MRTGPRARRRNAGPDIKDASYKRALCVRLVAPYLTSLNYIRPAQSEQNAVLIGCDCNGRLVTHVFRLRFAWQHHRRRSSRPAAYNGKWRERTIIDHVYNAALYSGELRRWCCRPTFTIRPLRQLHRPTLSRGPDLRRVDVY